MYDLIVNLIASVLAAAAAWTAQFLIRYRKRSVLRLFLGLHEGTDCLLVCPRHASSTRPESVHRRDVAALVDIATLVKTCGANARVIGADEAPREFGRLTEFCVGGPESNSRTAAHLRSAVPGVYFEKYPASADELTFWVGQRAFRQVEGVHEYALLVKIPGRGRNRPVFVIAGQRAGTNLATARYLSSEHGELRRKYGRSGRFCIVLKINQSDSYGSDFVQVDADLTGQAFWGPRPKAAGQDPVVAMPGLAPVDVDREPS